MGWLNNPIHLFVTVQVVTDLVQGEFMQLGSKETENERFAHYLTKTYRKTASLMANSVKSVSIVFESSVGIKAQSCSITKHSNKCSLPLFPDNYFSRTMSRDYDLKKCHT